MQEASATPPEAAHAEIATPDTVLPEVAIAEAPIDERAPAPGVSEPSVDTGRLFRSQGVAGPSTAVLALSSDHGRRLRTLTRTDVEAAPVPRPVAADLLVDQGPVPDTASPGDMPADGRTGSRRRTGRRAATADGLTAGGVYVLIIGVTLVVAFANALLAGGKVGWPTGLALVAVTVFCALKVRREDDTVAIITPPVAFFLAAITAGQLFVKPPPNSLLNRAVVTFFTLADNWVWIIGATVAALVIVIVRRRR
jgi:hypothetical protein